MKLHRLLFFALAAALAALVLSACSDDDGGEEDANGAGATAVKESHTPAAAPSTDLPEEFFSCEGGVPGEAPDASAFPVEVSDPSGRTVTFDEPPQAIASLSAGHTETLFAIRADDQVIAVDNTSDCPEEVTTLPQIDAFNLSIESVIALEPDLVILFYDPGDVVASLEAAGISVLMMQTPESLEDVYEHVEVLGQATGHAARAEELVAAMESDIESISEAVTAQFEGATIYHELDAQLFSAGPGSFIGDYYEKLGAENIATEPYPQLSSEAIIAANPEVIILADEDYGESAETVAARPGWDAISAVQNDRIYGIDPDIVSRPGPRVVDAMRILADYLYGTEFSH